MENIKSLIERKIIKEFCIFTSEFPEIDDIDYELLIVDDIYDYVYNDDEVYAQDVLREQDTLLGLFYVNKEGKLSILLQKADEIDMYGTLLHEVVHLFDFVRLADYKNNYNYRELQDDIFFVLWSEFHADYLSYRYLIYNEKSAIVPMEVALQIRNKLQEYYSSDVKLDLQTAINKSVRCYGQYAALYVNYPDDLNQYLDRFYFNRNFLVVYNYLLEHKTFDKFICDYGQWVTILKAMEK